MSITVRTTTLGGGNKNIAISRDGGASVSINVVQASGDDGFTLKINGWHNVHIETITNGQDDVAVHACHDKEAA